MTDPGGHRLRVVIATDIRFWRSSIGSQQRVGAIYRHLVARGNDLRVAFVGRPYQADVDLLASLGWSVQFSLPMQSAAEVDVDCRPRTEALSPRALEPRRRLKQAFRWLRAALTQFGRPRTNAGWIGFWRTVQLRSPSERVADHRNAHALVLMSQLIRDQTPDVILVEHIRLAWLVKALKPQLPPGTRWLLDTHDVMHERQLRFNSIGEVHELDITASEEGRWLSNFDALLAIQSRDAGIFRAIVGTTVRVLTVMHPVAAGAVPTVVAGPVGVGFMGSSMAPNAMALKELVDEVWPRVRAAVGESALLIVGGSVCETLKEGEGAAALEGVRLLGFVGDMDDFYTRVDIIASPIRVGGGLKIKHVEALCKGKALVTMAVGAEGLEHGAGDAFQIARDAADMAQRLVQLIQSPARRQQQGSRALAFARQSFSEAAVFSQLDEFLTPTTSRRGA